ncbi:sulfotransferase family cytosolic 1B member 1 [Lingula anatina]|uniref:Sulfotransferase family cytosolic 1B member 1 n=1 Tax=Lingula anatina TaxID=7574 RepID=A0A1S3HDJ0_LINAN|nr:sulfotransferase family cytosolic 1B member 1 [Lingula anatina]XP_013384111.1 sulfotransferase family cytosolic 1B member 1 [Lingula anatina]XP_013384112.1 sulfotransferase family cytosolic 1B member 1 [Lingula anatina]|eukprot:XP_013384110.1 sulfotransferase family cytosolic 1B member 1 [Lingula anatina]
MAAERFTGNNGKGMLGVCIDGEYFPAFPNVAENIKQLRGMEIHKDDVIVTGYPKAGLHWICEIVHMLLCNTTQVSKFVTGKAPEVVLHMEKVSLQDLDNLAAPRIMWSHLHHDRLPRDMVNKHPKIVHIVRNPKDSAVSMYYFCKRLPFVKYDGEWDDFLEMFMDGKVLYGSWFDYEADWQQKETNVFNISYEQLREAPLQVLPELSAFLGCDRSPEFLQKVAEATSFENMKTVKEEQMKATPLPYKNGVLYRKATVGDWKHHFTVHQNERFDALWNKKMPGAGFSSVITN